MHAPDWWEVAIRLFAAMLIAGVVGIDREVRQRPAGLRTHMLVGLGSAAFFLFAIKLAFEVAAAGPLDVVSTDPVRIASGIIGGIGFLGAGTIIQSRGNVQGLTTAAGIWIAGAIGVSCGAGQFFLALMVMTLTVVCLLPIQLLENHLVAPVQRPSDDQ